MLSNRVVKFFESTGARPQSAGYKQLTQRQPGGPFHATAISRGAFASCS